MQASNTHKIIILDDDHYPEGRVSERIVPEFQKRGIDVKHYKTFFDLKSAFDREEIDADSLFIVDSTLEEEPDRHILDFSNTIPAMLDQLNIKHKHIIPASGGREGIKNNSIFFELLSRRDKTEDWEQRCLESGGLAGDPETVVNSIIHYHRVLYPNELSVETKKEGAPELILKGNGMLR